MAGPGRCSLLMHIWRISPHASFMVRLARFKFAIEGSNTKNVAYQFILTKIGGNCCRSQAPMRTNVLWNDGLYCKAQTAPNDVNCTNDNGPIWSYCQAMPLGIATYMHRLTGNATLLTSGLALTARVRASLVAATPLGNVLYEKECSSVCGKGTGPCAPSTCPTQECAVCSAVNTSSRSGVLPQHCQCDGNQQIFKGIYARYSGYFNAYMNGSAAADEAFLRTNAASVLANNRVGDTLDFGLLWQARRCHLCPRTTSLPEGKSILGVIYGVLLWADMDAGTPLGAWGRSVMSVGRARCLPRTTLTATAVSDSHLDLGRAPYVLYGVKYIDPVSLAPVAGHANQAGDSHLGPPAP